MWSTLLLTAVLLWSAPAAADKPVILVLGDSLSAAYGLDAEAGWVALLQQRLQARGLPYRVINASISGETTRGALGRLPQALDRHEPAIVIVALGGNDGLRGLPPARMRDNLAAIIEAARTDGARVLLAGVRMPPNYGPVYTRRFESVYRELARSHGVALVPSLLAGVEQRLDLMQPDGIHPLPQAQPRILENVWEGLVPLLGTESPQRRSRQAGG